MKLYNKKNNWLVILFIILYKQIFLIIYIFNIINKCRQESLRNSVD